ncbi:unnamed protein product [Schistosoma spindalis]|nr:unnamed protein product [Schistosoma spindale]
MKNNSFFLSKDGLIAINGIQDMCYILFQTHPLDVLILYNNKKIEVKQYQVNLKLHSIIQVDSY